MKLKDPRLTLLAGLALALNVNGPGQVTAAEQSAKQPMKLARLQAGAPVTVQSRLQGTVPDSTTTLQLTPVPDTGTSTSPLQPVPGDPAVIAPVPGQPMVPVAPVPRQPMGLHYGEWEQLDLNSNAAPRPLASPPSGAVIGTPLTPGPVFDASGAPVPLEVPGPYVSTDRFGYAPPPGTLGQTYKRRSRPIEDTKHPRVGAVEVNLPEYVDVSAKGLKVKWTGKVWRLESDSLIPGIPHIYEVHASWGEGTPDQVRTVRLIMGRIVDLDF